MRPTPPRSCCRPDAGRARRAAPRDNRAGRRGRRLHCETLSRTRRISAFSSGDAEASSRVCTTAVALVSSSLEQLRRNVGPQPDFLGKDAVGLGTLDQAGEAGFGNARAAIVGNAAGDLAIAAPHQHIGDRFAERMRAWRWPAGEPDSWCSRRRRDRPLAGAAPASAPARRRRCRHHWPACAAPSPAHCQRAPGGSRARRALWFRFPRSGARTRRRTDRYGFRCSSIRSVKEQRRNALQGLGALAGASRAG